MADALYFETISISELRERGLTDVSSTEDFVSTREPGAARAKLVVLVVDDEPVIADTLAIILNRKGCVAWAAYSGEHALELARITPPDVLVADVMMPGMSGVDLAIAVRDSWPSCKIFLFSGSEASLDLLGAARKRGYDFPLLSKPVHPDALLREVCPQEGTDKVA